MMRRDDPQPAPGEDLRFPPQTDPAWPFLEAHRELDRVEREASAAPDPNHLYGFPWSSTRTCRVCGCTDHRACIDPRTGEACAWVEPDLCSSCARWRWRYLLAVVGGIVGFLAGFWTAIGVFAVMVWRARHGG